MRSESFSFFWVYRMALVASYPYSQEWHMPPVAVPAPPAPPRVPPLPPVPIPFQIAPVVLPPRPPIDPRPIISRQQLQRILGFKVKDPRIYQQAFVHKSAQKDSQHDKSYDRLEYHGDAILGFIIATYLCNKFPDANEGFLTRVRTKLVSGKRLSEFGKRLGLQHHILMNAKALQLGWNANMRILEDVFESLIACVYIDMGISTTTRFVVHVVETFVDWDEVIADTNYKDRLMRYCQARHVALPNYEIMSDSEDDTDCFKIRVIVCGEVCGVARERSKKEAEQMSAKAALVQLSEL